MYSLWWVVISMAIFILMTCIVISILVDDIGGFLGISFLINMLPIAILITFIFASIGAPLDAKQEMLEFIECKEMVVEAIDNGEDLENIGITQKVIEKNEWLSKAKADKKLWGNGSQYIYCDLDSLDYIVIKKENENV